METWALEVLLCAVGLNWILVESPQNLGQHSTFRMPIRVQLETHHKSRIVGSGFSVWGLSFGFHGMALATRCRKAP